MKTDAVLRIHADGPQFRVLSPVEKIEMHSRGYATSAVGKVVCGVDLADEE